MKFLFLLWITVRACFDASVWATAVWCILCYFSNVLWLQCFGISRAIHFLSNLPFVNYISSHTKQHRLVYMRVESASVGLSVIFALLLSPLLTIAAIALLSVLQVWTNLETHWLHTLLFAACVIYNLSRASGKRRLAAVAHARSTQSASKVSRSVRVIDV